MAADQRLAPGACCNIFAEDEGGAGTADDAAEAWDELNAAAWELSRPSFTLRLHARRI
jgi:hypothetical protein